MTILSHEAYPGKEAKLLTYQLGYDSEAKEFVIFYDENEVARLGPSSTASLARAAINGDGKHG